MITLNSPSSVTQPVGLQQNMVSPDVIFLRGKKTTLRPIQESDLAHCVRWINDPEVRKFVKNTFPMTMSSEKEWYDKCSKCSDSEVILMIEADGKLIGSMGMHKIMWKDRVATTGALIGEKEYWGKGYGTDAKMALLEYAFNTLNLRKIMSRVYAFNKRSLDYSLHCGYKIEGRLSKQCFVDGKYWDEIILGLFKKDWLPHWKKHRKQLSKP